MENLVEWMAGETEVIGENLPRRHFVYHKSHLNPGRRGMKPATKRFSYGAAGQYLRLCTDWTVPTTIISVFPWFILNLLFIHLICLCIDLAVWTLEHELGIFSCGMKIGVTSMSCELLVVSSLESEIIGVKSYPRGGELWSQLYISVSDSYFMFALQMNVVTV
jgi:hypothetical protein